MNNDNISATLSRYGKVFFKLGQYCDNDRLAIRLVDTIGLPITTLTVNLPDEELSEGEFFVKTWSENEQIAQELLNTDIFLDTGKRVPTGWVEASVWKFKGGN